MVDCIEVLGLIDEVLVFVVLCIFVFNSEIYICCCCNLLIGIGVGVVVFMVVLLVLVLVLSWIFGDVSGGFNKDELGFNVFIVLILVVSLVLFGSVVKFIKVMVFFFDGGVDNFGEVDLVIDGNLVIFWKIDIYIDFVLFFSFKNGVGLML